MTAVDPFSTRVIRILLVTSALIYGFGFWVNRGLAFTDFRVLHLGAELAGQGRLESAYDSELFRAEAIEMNVDSARELDVFISTPPFAWALWPLSWLSANTAMAVWMVLSVLAVFGSMKLLRLPLWAGLVALLVPFGVANIYHAQTGFFALLWAAAIHRLCVDGRTVPAGLVAGLAVLKPTLLLGVAIWWIVDLRRWYPALLSAFALGTTLVSATLIGGFDVWKAFLAALDERSELDIVYNQPTISELVSRAVGFEIGTSVLTQIAILGLAAIALRMVLHTWPDRVDLVSGAAILASILVSPHLLIYDTTLVAIPFAIAVRAGVPRPILEQLVAIYVVSSLMTIMSFEPFASINNVVAPSTIGMLAAATVWIRAVGTNESSDIEGQTPNVSFAPIDMPNAA